jgi:two-component system chemotaxis sensor kinase CheA
VDFAPSAERAAAGITINSVRERVSAIADIVKVMPLSVPASDAAPGGLSFVLLLVTAVSDTDVAVASSAEASQVTTLLDVPELLPPSAALAREAALPGDVVPEPSARDEDSQRRNVLRVDVARVDEAMERLAGLIVTRSRLSGAIAALSATGADTRELKQIALENARQLRDLRSAILRVRMVPIMEILERVPLILRALKRASGKQLRLAIDGGEAELDKAVAERIFPAIVHLVRNAVDHGMETPAERRAAGKPEEGVLRITCSARSNTRLELVVSDDGRGIDRAAVAARARRETPDTDPALLDLLCEPGFSTREEATTTSGRGMGMDIVRRIVVDQLGGEVLLHSEPGRGTTFTLHVPLTIAIIDAFTLECGSQRFVVPVSAVEEIMEIDASVVVFTPITTRTRDGERLRMIQRRGEALPLIDLATLLCLPGAHHPAKKALVIRRAGQPLAFGIDRVIGQQEAVVRPLVDALVNVRGISGATDLGDGRPTLVLDFVALASTSAVEPRALRSSTIPPLLRGAP